MKFDVARVKVGEARGEAQCKIKWNTEGPFITKDLELYPRDNTYY